MALTLSSVLPVLSAAPKESSCVLNIPAPKTSTALKIDGDLSDAQWQKSPFIPFTTKAGYTGTIKTLWNAQQLFFGIHINDKEEPKEPLVLRVYAMPANGILGPTDPYYILDVTRALGGLHRYTPTATGASTAYENSISFTRAIKATSDGAREYEIAFPALPANKKVFRLPLKKNTHLNFSLDYRDQGAHWNVTPSEFPYNSGYDPKGWPGVVLSDASSATLDLTPPRITVAMTQKNGAASIAPSQPFTFTAVADEPESCVVKTEILFWGVTQKICYSKNPCILETVSPAQGGNYLYEVRSYNASGILTQKRGTLSITKNISVKASVIPPSPPIQVQVTDKGTGHTLVVSWGKSSAGKLHTVKIYRSTSPNAPGKLLTQTSHSRIASIVDDWVQKGVPYYYTLRAIDLQGNASSATEAIIGIAK